MTKYLVFAFLFALSVWALCTPVQAATHCDAKTSFVQWLINIQSDGPLTSVPVAANLASTGRLERSGRLRAYEYLIQQVNPSTAPDVQYLTFGRYERTSTSSAYTLYRSGQCLCTSANTVSCWFN
jgi:hypothetical protein